MTEFEVKRRADDVDISQLPNELPTPLRLILARRGITQAQQLQLTSDRLPAVQHLKDVDKAARRLADAIAEGSAICICGDFDADGATATALMVSTLRAFGAAQVDYLVPNRFSDGYGLSEPVVAQALKLGSKVIVTVDNGISAHSAIDYAQQQGIDVIVTDHHLPSASLPKALAIVNPNRDDCQFPSKSIAGVGVAFYLLLALRQLRRSEGHEVPNLANWLDLVALGTVADVVKLDAVNRILVEQGLRRIRAGHCRLGIKALLAAAGREPSQLQASDLGFVLGPRINAAGRLDDISVGIECLLAESPERAQQLALQLDQLNRERREIEREMREQAEQYVATYSTKDIATPNLLVLFEENWHQGVIGIVAGRLKEQLQRPVIAFAKGEQGELKGSARSVAGLHIRDFIERIDSQRPGLIDKFGGHAMAAGLTLPAEHYAEFKQLASALAEQELDAEQLQRVVWSDGRLDASCFSVPFVQQLYSLGPFGQGFAEPLFDDEFVIIQQRIVGEKHLKLVLQTQERVNIDAIAFNVDLQIWPDPTINRLYGVYKVQLNHFRGQTSVQLQLEHLRPVR